MYDLLLTLHLLAVATWLGGGITGHVVGRRAVAAGDPERTLAFVRDYGWLGPRLYAPASVVLLVAGLLLVDEAGYSMGDPWISIAFAGWAATFLIGVLFYGRQVEAIERAAADHGAGSPQATRAVRGLLAVNSIEILILVLMVVDMAVKPGA